MSQSGARKSYVRPWLVPTFAALILIPLFCALGFWQLERADEKRVLQAEYDRRATAEPVSIGLEPVAAESLQYARVQMRGVFESDYQVLWDNRIHRGVPGYHVITPLRLAGGRTRVLVNRGWVEAPATREELPATEVPDGEVGVSGVAVVPRVEFMLGDLDPLRASPPTVWQQLDLARYAAQVDWPIQPIVVLLDPEAPGGFVREWQRLDAGIAVHHGYAFQWFVLAAGVLVLYLVFLIRSRGQGRRSDSPD